jgi:anti-sigma B factor antagonist
MALLSQEPLNIEDLDGPHPGQRILRLQGPVVLGTLFLFQSTLRAREDRALIIDFSGVPYVDSAGIGALVGAYVTHNKAGRSLACVGVNERVRNALKVTRVEPFFRFFDTLAEAEAATGA